MNFRNIVISASVAVVLTLGFGCSSSSTSDPAAGGSCPAVGTKVCPNDAAVTQASADLCNKCKTQGAAYDSCEGLSTAANCGADGKSAAQKTDMTKCMTEYNNLVSCLTM